MRVSPVVATAAVLAAVLAGAPAQAAADDPNVLTTGSAAGAAVAVGDVLTAAVATGTTADFATESGGATGVTCAESSFTATVTDNPAAPGVATESTTAQTFGSCTSNIFGVTQVNSVTVDNTPFATTVESGTGTVTVSGTETAPIQTTLNLDTIIGAVTCVYASNTGSITGVSSNTDNSIAFADQPFTLSSGSFACPASGFFTATYAPVVDTSVADSPVVFVN